MPPLARPDPYGGYKFEVSITGVSTDGKQPKGSFSEVSGLEATVDAIDYRNGSEDVRFRKLRGLKKFANIVLKRGITGDIDFWNWIVKGMNGAVQRTDGEIRLLDEANNTVMTWQFTRGWPCKFTGPSLNAKNNEIAIDTLEIACEALSVDGQQG